MSAVTTSAASAIRASRWGSANGAPDGPSGDVTDTKLRYSLMNWGHDPLKDS